MSITLQYVIIGVIFVIIALWLWRKITCMIKRKNSGCCGCALSETCKKKDLKR